VSIKCDVDVWLDMFISVSSQPNNNIESFRFVCEAILHLRSSQYFDTNK